MKLHLKQNNIRYYQRKKDVLMLYTKSSICHRINLNEVSNHEQPPRAIVSHGRSIHLTHHATTWHGYLARPQGSKRSRCHQQPCKKTPFHYKLIDERKDEQGYLTWEDFAYRRLLQRGREVVQVKRRVSGKSIEKKKRQV